MVTVAMSCSLVEVRSRVWTMSIMYCSSHQMGLATRAEKLLAQAISSLRVPFLD